MRHPTRRRLLGAGAAAVFHRSLERPNLVLFLSDDHGYLDSPVYGSRAVRTPNMVSLAESGLVFENMFTGSPTCVPSRAVLMSGLMPAKNGALPNHSGLKEGVRTLPSYLKELGYETFHFGKGHFQPPGNYLDWTAVPSEIRRGPLNSDLDTQAFDRWLAGRAAGANKAPVCLVVNSHSPHVYWPDNDGYDPAAVELPPTFVDTPETRMERTKYYTDVTKADTQLGEVMESCRKYLSRNTLFIYSSDNGAQWPFAKWSLYDAGIRMPFIARWPDVIQPRTRTRAMASFCDILPTFIELAGGAPPAGLDGQSFASVLKGKTGRHRSEIFAAHSGDRDFNVYPCRCVRTERFKYILNLHPEFKYTTHIDVAGLQDGRAYFDTWAERAKTSEQAAEIVRRYHQRPGEELYEVTTDPHETRNLAGGGKHQRELQRLRTAVRDWMRSQGDQGEVFGKPRLL